MIFSFGSSIPAGSYTQQSIVVCRSGSGSAFIFIPSHQKYRTRTNIILSFIRHPFDTACRCVAVCIPDTLLPLFPFPLHSVALTLFTFVLSIFYLLIFLDSFTNCCLLPFNPLPLLSCSARQTQHIESICIHGYMICE